MRIIGLRAQEHAIVARTEAVNAEFASRLDATRAELAECLRRIEQTRDGVEVLGRQLSEMGRYDTERGDTVQNMINSLGADILELKRMVGSKEDAAYAISELRGDLAKLRADLVLQAESGEARPR